MLNNFLCENDVFHYRKVPFKNYFKYKICSILFDIKQINKVKNLKLLSINKYNLYSIYLKDYGNLKGDLYNFIINKIKKNYNIKKKYTIYLLTFLILAMHD